MNWGKGITIALVSFIVFIVTLVVGFFSHKVDLESENYYEREIVYDKEIEALNNAKELERQIEFIHTEKNLIVQIPEGNYTQIQLKMLRPDDKTEDKTFEIEGTHFFSIDKNQFKKGKYKVSIVYRKDNLVCQQNNSIYIQ